MVQMCCREEKMKRVILLAAVFVACFPCGALADGKFYTVPEKVPPDLPYQRALIAYDGGRELLILQSKFEGEAKNFGWIVPLPAVPELASMEKEHCKVLFNTLGSYYGQQVYHVKGEVLMLLFLAVIVTLFAIRIWRWLRGKKAQIDVSLKKASSFLVIIWLFLFLAFIAVPGMETTVEIVRAQQVGIYDVKVIKAESGEDIIAWLNEHGYRFNDKDREVFESYVKRGWCFVTARVDLERAEKEGFSSEEGLVNPLVMLFESEKTVYPLALTGTIGSEVEVLLYVFGSHKVADASGRFPVRYAGETDMEYLKRYMVFQPEDFHEKWDFKQNYLTKLKARLTPEQMNEDLVLEKAPDNEPYREHVYRW